MKPVPAKTLLKGLWQGAPAGLAITAIEHDSRKVCPGCLFACIRGKRADGHDFASAAFAAGAAVILAERPVDGVPQDKTVIVPAVLDALIQIAANCRDRFSPLVLGITGSVGKTSTREFCSAVFSAFGSTLATERNLNTEVGLPQTLFRLNEETRYAVIEMGMQGPGEIRKLAKAARPHGAIITRIGMAHLEQMGTVENILRAKLEICEALEPGALLVLNGDDEKLRAAAILEGLQVVYAGVGGAENEVRAADVRREAHGLVFKLLDARWGSTEVFIPAVGRHNVNNALLAYTAATRLGLNPQQAAAALAGYRPAGSRQRVEEIEGVTLIEDFYNAGPESMAAALQTLGELPCEGKRVAVLGDMLELGVQSEDAHRNLAPLAKSAGAHLVVTVGRLAALTAQEVKRRGIEVRVCDTNKEAAALLKAEVKCGDLLLLKASRGMHFEEILRLYTGNDTQHIY